MPVRAADDFAEIRAHIERLVRERFGNPPACDCGAGEGDEHRFDCARRVWFWARGTVE